MPGAVIVADQLTGAGAGVPGVARNDLWQNQSINLYAGTSGNVSFEWSLLSRPAGSAAVLTTPTTSNSGFTPDLRGTYRVQLVTNGGGAGNVQVLVFRVRYDDTGVLLQRGWAYPAFSEVAAEANYGGNARGWAEALEYILEDIRLNAFSSSITFGGDLSGSSSSQTVVQIQGQSVSNTSPSADHAFLWSGTAWGPGFITNNNIDAAAAIAGSKINPDFSGVEIKAGNILFDDNPETAGTSHTIRSAIQPDLSSDGSSIEIVAGDGSESDGVTAGGGGGSRLIRGGGGGAGTISTTAGRGGHTYIQGGDGGEDVGGGGALGGSVFIEGGVGTGVFSGGNVFIDGGVPDDAGTEGTVKLASISGFLELSRSGASTDVKGSLIVDETTTLNQLTASQFVKTDASKQLISQFGVLLTDIMNAGGSVGDILYWDGSNFVRFSSPGPDGAYSLSFESGAPIGWVAALQAPTGITVSSGPYNLANGTRFVSTNPSSGSFQVNLPSAPNTWQVHEIKHASASTNTVTVHGNGKNIDGSTSMALGTHECVVLVYNGTEWEIH